MNVLFALLPVIIPLLVIFIPGCLLFTRPVAGREIPLTGARAVLWSASFLILSSLLLNLLRLPLVIALGLGLIAVVFVLLRQQNNIYIFFQQFLLIAAPITILYFLFSLPFIFIHDGLPTGDAQKAIIWANEMLATNHLPDYSQAGWLLNRDPVDFYTPGLHSLTALAMQFTTYFNEPILPVITVGFLSIAVSLAAALVAVALAIETYQPANFLALSFFTSLWLLANTRFLRYLKEPGYHWQNIVGELLFFGALLLTIILVKKWRRSDAYLLLLVLAALVLSHQFSAFLAFFALAPGLIWLSWSKRHSVYRRIVNFQLITAFLAISIFILFMAVLALGLQQKLPHFFNGQPHLLDETPNLAGYFTLLGSWWLVAGMGGVFMLIKRGLTSQSAIVLIISGILLFLTQGPRLGIDIPPVRTLFYLVIPASLLTAIFCSAILERIKKNYLVLAAALILFMIVPVSSVYSNFTGLSHTVRTNSTLSAAYWPVIDYLSPVDQEINQAILVDDYNRRSSSWLALSGRPMYARISADIAKQMAEAKQSEKRYQLYLKLLDYEKIFSLPSLPQIQILLDKQAIQYVTGVMNTSDGFSLNPNLNAVAAADDLVIYQKTMQYPSLPSPAEEGNALNPSVDMWLLKPTTLANDIGDNEDTFKHLPISLRATRLSRPQFKTGVSYRVSTSPVLPVGVNVGGYIRTLWDQDDDNMPDVSLEIMVKILDGPERLTLIAPDGHSFSISTDGTLTKLPASSFIINEDGLIDFQLLNPAELAINFDLIAVGLARTP